MWRSVSSIQHSASRPSRLSKYLPLGLVSTHPPFWPSLLRPYSPQFQVSPLQSTGCANQGAWGTTYLWMHSHGYGHLDKPTAFIPHVALKPHPANMKNINSSICIITHVCNNNLQLQQYHHLLVCLPFHQAYFHQAYHDLWKPWDHRHLFLEITWLKLILS